MNRKDNTYALVSATIVGVLIVVAMITGVAVWAGKAMTDDSSTTRAAADRSSAPTGTPGSGSYDDPSDSDSSAPDYYDPPAYEPPPTTYYGGIAYSGSGAYVTTTNNLDGEAAKTDAVNQCNTTIWGKGWSSDSYCGYVSIQTGQCASVAAASSATGWGPTGWSSGTGRSVVVRRALDECNSLGQGSCYELVTICM